MGDFGWPPGWELLLAKLRAAGLGKRSERTNAEQLALLLDALLKQTPQPEMDPDAEAREDAALTAEIARADAASPTVRRARQSWRTSAVVDREIHTHDVPTSAQQCGTCGRTMRGIGHDERQLLSYVPARFVVHEHQLQTYACGSCKDGVATTAGPGTALGQGSAD
uniref:IS66 family transposase zinc-finger binding domain-containing protein n=1 Tax=Gemmatimonas sp. TaxID=1962908 RepID=UPI0039837C56